MQCPREQRLMDIHSET